MNGLADFLGIEPASPDDARVVILPVPYEATVTYGGGTARGPEAILQASTQVELHDEQRGGVPAEVGIHTDHAFRLPQAEPETIIEAVADRFGFWIDAGMWVVMLGGEHSITAGGVRAAAARHPGLQVVQLDAHADLRESYEGSRWSHACAMARTLEHAPVLAVGIRSYGAGEAARIREGIEGYRMVPAWELEKEGWIERALDRLEPGPVYLSVDLDYFDPSVMPATGTPEPGGGRWWPTVEFLEELFRRREVVAADMVELAPIEGLHHPDFTAARLAYKLIGCRFLTPGRSAG
jgi:agmatinase